MLTSKGMIVADFHVLRDDSGFTLITAFEARQTALDLFRRQLPPRLAKVTDKTESDRTIWLLGQRAQETLGAAGLAFPADNGRAQRPSRARTPWRPGRPSSRETTERLRAIAESLERAGARRTGPDDLEAARILAGWPAPGREIDSRRCRRKCASRRSAACRTRRGATSARKPWRGSTSAVM
jgi:folate-binding Fe-S cluster repair protein YgfZ